MGFTKKKILTLNIESTDLRFLVTNGKRVENWGSLTFNTGLVKEGLISDIPAVGKVIREATAEVGANGKEVIVSLSGFQCIQRLPDLPRLSRQLMDEALLRESKRTMPVSLDRLYLSWQAVNNGNESQRYLLLGIPRNLMDAEVQCLRQSGITPRVVKLKPLALSRMVNRSEAVIIDIERESSDIIVVSAGVSAIVRTITMRSDYSLAKRVQYLVEESQRVFQFYDSSHPDEPLSKATPLFLTGELAGDAEVCRGVAAGLEYQVEPLVSPLECPPDFPIPQYAVNIGLALKEALLPEGTSIPDINILPDVYRSHHPSAKQVLFIPGILAGLALLAPLYLLASSATTDFNRARAEMGAINQQLQARQAEAPKIKQIQDALAKAEQNLQSLDAQLQKLGSGRLAVSENLRLAAVSTLPAGATLTSITLEEGTLELEGKAPSYEVALNYAYALRQKFSSVLISSLSTEETEEGGKVITFDFVVSS